MSYNSKCSTSWLEIEIVKPNDLRGSIISNKSSNNDNNKSNNDFNTELHNQTEDNKNENLIDKK